MNRRARAGPKLIALLTDFGDGSVYVGAMKGVIASIDSALHVVDLTHGVRPQAVDEAAFLLGASYRFFPQATLFVTVVDPGVGGTREIAVVEAGGYIFLAPDNGVLTTVLRREEPVVIARHLTTRAFSLPLVSATFHGRDVLAPIAARLACGEIEPLHLGPEIPPERLVRLASLPAAAADRGSSAGRIAHIDRFGNLVTDVEPPAGSAPRRVELLGRAVERAARTYAEAPSGEPFAYVGSFGTVEVALPMGNAALAFGAAPGLPVRVFFEGTASQ